MCIASVHSKTMDAESKIKQDKTEYLKHLNQNEYGNKNIK